MGFWHLLSPAIALLCYCVQHTEAQYYQDYMPDTTNPGQFLYRSVPGIVPWNVLKTDPFQAYLVYNCYYMKDICKNAENFAATPRGLNLHPQSNLPNNWYGYDLDTGDTPSGEPNSRQQGRRDASCPDSWKNNHPCPETDQSRPWRHDGQWFTTLLEPGTTTNNLMNIRDPVNNNILRYSNIRYTCDEFPPATWVEGGNGVGQGSPSNTRCAALTCSTFLETTPVKAEQNWQGLVHGLLRTELVTYAQNKPGYIPNRSIVLFTFMPSNLGADGIAARVMVMRDNGDGTDSLQTQRNTMQARDAEGVVGENSTIPRKEWTVEELMARVKVGEGYEHLVHANLSYVSESVLKGQAIPMPMMDPLGRLNRWDQMDNNEAKESLPTLNKTITPPKSLPKSAPRSLHRRAHIGKNAARSISEHKRTPLLKRASVGDIQAARNLVKKAKSESSKLNKARVANPLRNKYGLKPGTVVGGARIGNNRVAAVNEAVPPLLVISDEIAAAAALVAEADGTHGTQNITKRAAAGTYWMQSISRKGTVPWGDEPNYAVFRNVLDYGAIGDGITDDTKAINKAMGTNSTRCGKGCNGSTTKNAIVYFPPGTYLVSSTIALPFGTQVIGDANVRPTIVASASFVGLGVLSTDEYTGEGGTGTDGMDPEYYVNTANFYRQIRNVVIDVRKVAKGEVITCLHYQVAQATSLQNVELVATPGSTQIGLFAENGSGGGIADVTFTGGGIGLKGGNQQFTAQRLTFNGCTVGIQVIWDWGWVWKSITMNNVKTAFQLVGDGGVGNIGSVSVMDSSFTNVGTVVVVKPITATPGTGSTGIALDNIALSGVSVAVADTTGATLLAASSHIDQWTVGPVYSGAANTRSFSKGGKIGNYRRHSTLLDAKGNYFERPKPQYENVDASAIVHAKDLGCKGDGSTDDTAAFQAALYSTLGKILYVDAGSYILTSTVTIPSGAKIVGETWSQLVASGAYFADASNPKVLIKVGNAGDVGNVEMQDLLFTTRGATAGLVLIEWNIQADAQGSAGLWDCHARIGGATGSKLTPLECPPVTSGINQGCSAASLMMHLTPSASGYFENMWLWGADHMIDDPDLKSGNNSMEQTSIYIARGFLIESTNPTWLYGTASEHAVFYQYNFHSAANIYAGMLQTESPYYQPTPPPPAPFANVLGRFPGDPAYKCTAGDEFSGCDESWAVVMTGSKNIFVAGAGIYSWFSTYAQTCIDSQLCQKALMLLQNNFANVRFQNLVTIGAKYMAVMDGKGITAQDNLNVKEHPAWSQISILDVGSNGTQFNEVLWIDPKIWQMDQPEVTCSPPCQVQLPPWTGATSTVNYPLVTVSQGGWTSTITQAPLTITEWVFEVVTIGQGSGNIKKRADTSVWPKAAITPVWPAFVYTGGVDGKLSTTSASGPFPTPPPIGPNAAAPPSGNWPKRAVNFVYGSPESPLTEECLYLNFLPQCFKQPWYFGGMGSPGGDDVENLWDLKTRCPFSSKSSSSTTTTTTTTKKADPTPPAPSPSPYEHGDARLNSVKCFNSGENTENIRMQNAANSFCRGIEKSDLGPGAFFSGEYPFSYNGGVGTVKISISLEVKKKCEFKYNYNLCKKYLSVPTDSCNCGGINWKQGGIVENNCLKWMIDPQLSN